jgi:hypothetical protein
MKSNKTDEALQYLKKRGCGIDTIHKIEKYPCHTPFDMVLLQRLRA